VGCPTVPRRYTRPMNRRLPTVLSILLLLLVLCVALFLYMRAPVPEPVTVEPEPAPAAEPEPEPAAPQAQDRDGLVGPAGIAEALPALQACWVEHSEAEGLEPGLTLVFTITVDPTATRRLARVEQVRVRGADDSEGQEATPFEACVHGAVAGIELLAPGARDSIAIPMTFQLGGSGG
jgi:hypothetical protein